jgi:tetratricopeptide (TPR) repeat protein
VPPSRENYTEIINPFERALVLDPRSVDAQSWLANALILRVIDGTTTSATADIRRAEELTRQSLTLSPRNWLAHYSKGQMLRAQGRYKEAIPEYEIAIASDRSCVVALNHISQCKLFSGSIEEAIPPQEQAIRISPRDPYIGIYFIGIGTVHLLRSRTEEAIVWLEKARSANPEHPNAHGFLASAYALMDETERAAVELAQARTLSGDGRYSSVRQLKAAAKDMDAPAFRSLFETTYFAGLRKAGMPEE